MSTQENAADKAETTPLTREEMDELVKVRQETPFNQATLATLSSDKELKKALHKIQDGDDNKPGRGWHIVFNHPQEYIEQYTDLGWLSPEECMTFLGRLITHKVKRSLVRGGGGMNSTGMACHFEFGEEITSRYVGVNFEVANTEGKTKHCHIIVFCEKDTGIRFSTLMRLFYPFKPHADKFKGGWKANCDYIYKRGKHERKNETLYREPAFFGNPGVIHVSADYDKRINELIDEGYRPTEIVSMGAEYAKRQRTIEALFNARLEMNAPSQRDVEFVYVCGEKGAGKSQLCQTLAAEVAGVSFDKNKDRTRWCYMASATDHIWDDYEGQPITILEEMRSAAMPWREFLQVCDRYVNRVSARYRNKLMLWTHLFINSTVFPEELYPSLTDPLRKNRDGTEPDEEDKRLRADNKEQLYRRINRIVYCFVDPHYSPEDNPEMYFCQVSLEGTKYRGILDVYKGKQQLVDMADAFLRERHPDEYEDGVDDETPLNMEELEDIFGNVSVKPSEPSERRIRGVTVRQVPRGRDRALEGLRTP